MNRILLFTWCCWTPSASLGNPFLHPMAARQYPDGNPSSWHLISRYLFRKQER